MVDGTSEEVLKGTTLEVYQLLLKSNKPLGVREIQRKLKMSSPSVATYHLTKLEDAGILKRKDGGFIVNKFLLENSIKISRFLIPRFFFYSMFAITALVIELTVLRPVFIYREYVFCVIVTAVLFFFLCYETVKVWCRGNL